MTLRACSDCGRTCEGRRCAIHAAAAEARRRGVTRHNYGPGWARLSRNAIAAHVEVHGWVCPGWGVPAHPSRELTADHRLPIARGGTSAAGNLAVLCRSCNSAKRDRVAQPIA